jgi:hypothetical protein
LPTPPGRASKIILVSQKQSSWAKGFWLFTARLISFAFRALQPIATAGATISAGADFGAIGPNAPAE